MADIKQKFAASAALTITLTSLANAAARESVNQDNSTNLFLDALVYVAAKLAAGTPASDKAVYVYAYGSEDGTNYGDNVTGADAALTMRSPSNLRLIGVINTPDAGALTYKSQPMSVAAAFGGILPRRWGIVVENKTGLALDSTGNAASFTGIHAQSV